MNKARQFNVTFADLVDNLTIDQIKEVLLPEEQAKTYASEIAQLEHDIDIILSEKEIKLTAEHLRMIILLAQVNLYVWYNKDKMTGEPKNYMELLRFAQDLNSLRNHVKNLILEEAEEATPASKRATFFNYNGDEWYADILKNI
ncbi:hypothetical protein ACFLYN_01650 [Chloroflexota bacterium]